MEPASSVISLLGGSSRVADICGLHRVTVAKWKVPSQGGSKGTGGRIPQKYFQTLLTAAHELGIPLTSDDLIFGVRKDEQQGDAA